jgi:hypothetical protein
MAAITSLTESAIIALIAAGTWPQQYAVATANLNAVSDQLAVDVSATTNVSFHVKNIGSVADVAGTTVFEASIDSTTGTDGTWFTVQAVRTNDNTIETGRAAASLAAGAPQGYAWEAAVGAFRWFRIRNTVAVTATSSMKWSLERFAAGYDPAPAITSHAVTISGTPAVTATISGTPAVTATISGTPAVTATITGTPAVTISGTPAVTATITGTPAVTISGTPAVTATTTPASGTSLQLQSAASTNATLVKASAGSVFELTVFNSSAAIVYVKLYNKATAPAPATDAALLMDVIPVPASTGRVAVEYGALGKRFPAGIGIAIVNGPTNTDAVAVAVGVTVDFTYI